MSEYRDYIVRNLQPYYGIVDDPGIVDSIDEVLVRLERSSCATLLRNFCSQSKPERARDFLLEILIFQWLASDTRVRELIYEPQDEGRPDFRFVIDEVRYDLQIKRIHNTKSELPKAQFLTEVDRRLRQLARSWLMEIWVSDDIKPNHTNRFAEHVSAHLNEWIPGSELGENEYQWPKIGKPLIRFSFAENVKTKPGIRIALVMGGTEDGFMAPVDERAFRASVEKHLKLARDSFGYPVSTTQANWVIVQMAGDVIRDEDDLANALYGDDAEAYRFRGDTMIHWPVRLPNGLFREKRFSSVSGLILVPKRASFLDAQASGWSYINPMHVNLVLDQPAVFDPVKYAALRQ